MRLSWVLARSSSWLVIASGRNAARRFNPDSFLLNGATTWLATMPDGAGKNTAATTRTRSRPSDAAAASPTFEERPKLKRKTRDAALAINRIKSDPPDIGSTTANPWYSVFTKGDELYNRYMATEWGVEKHGDVPLFEKLSLEGAQSGLSWLTVLRKREAYRRVFHRFDIDKVASMTDADVRTILDETSDDTSTIVVRHRGKIESVINNAKCIQRIRAENGGEGAFDRYLWSFVDHAPILNAWNGSLSVADTKTEESIAMSKSLKKLGFRFVGPTTCYAMMQSVGMVIDHPKDSPEWERAFRYLKERPGGFQDRASQQLNKN